MLDAHAAPAEIEAVVSIHRRVLGGGFLSSLGDGALTLLFEHAAKSSTAVLLVARSGDDSQVVGFLLGTLNTGRFYRDFLRRRALRALFVLGLQLLSVRRVFGICETLLYPARHRGPKLPDAELLDIAVIDTAQGSGIGRGLYQCFCDILRQHGVLEFRVTTGESLPGAHRFYEALGARRLHDIVVHKGQTTRIYLCDTAADGGAPRNVRASHTAG